MIFLLFVFSVPCLLSSALTWAVLLGSSVRSDIHTEECIDNFDCPGAGGDPHLYKDGRRVVCGCNGYLTYINNRLITVTARHLGAKGRNHTSRDYTVISEVGFMSPAHWGCGVQRAASPWRTLGIRSCRTFCSDLA